MTALESYHDTDELYWKRPPRVRYTDDGIPLYPPILAATGEPWEDHQEPEEKRGVEDTFHGIGGKFPFGTKWSAGIPIPEESAVCILEFLEARGFARELPSFAVRGNVRLDFMQSVGNADEWRIKVVSGCLEFRDMWDKWFPRIT